MWPWRGWAPGGPTIATWLWALAGASSSDFAAGEVRALVDDYGYPVHLQSGRPVARELWDFKDLTAFVAAAPRERQMRLPLCGEIPVRIIGA